MENPISAICQALGTIASSLDSSSQETTVTESDDTSIFSDAKVLSTVMDTFEKVIDTISSDKTKETKDSEKTEKEKEKEEIQKQIEEIQDLMKSIMAKINALPDGDEKKALQDQYNELNSQCDDLISQLKNGGSSNNSGSSSSSSGVAPMSTGSAYDPALEYGKNVLNQLNQGVAARGGNVSGGYSTGNTSGVSSTGNSTSTGDTSSASSSTQVPVTTTIDSKLASALDKKLGSGFSAKLEQVAANTKCNPNDLLGLMFSECGLNPHCVNSIGATGLIQFLPSTARGLGTTTGALASMSAVQQLDYVEKFLQNNKKTYLGSDAQLDAGTLYSLVFLPAYSKNETLCSAGSGYYNGNRGLDYDKNGSITKTDLANHIGKKYQEMYKSLMG